MANIFNKKVIVLSEDEAKEAIKAYIKELYAFGDREVNHSDIMFYQKNLSELDSVVIEIEV